MRGQGTRDGADGLPVRRRQTPAERVGEQLDGERAGEGVALAVKLLVYALGRGLSRPTSGPCARLRGLPAQDYRFSGLILEIVRASRSRCAEVPR